MSIRQKYTRRALTPKKSIAKLQLLNVLLYFSNSKARQLAQNIIL
jgi:hypothetical protein